MALSHRFTALMVSGVNLVVVTGQKKRCSERTDHARTFRKRLVKYPYRDSGQTTVWAKVVDRASQIRSFDCHFQYRTAYRN
jgi:hypothetical protein